jgi:hypothetical protein
MGSKNKVAFKNNCSTLWDICHMHKNYKDRYEKINLSLNPKHETK